MTYYMLQKFSVIYREKRTPGPQEWKYTGTFSNEVRLACLIYRFPEIELLIRLVAQ
jgi:hypothetical protein